MRSILLGTEMGKHGFIRPNRQDIDVVNVDILDQMASSEGRLDLATVKVLGRGRVTKKLTVSAAAFSVSAKAKIEAAGGQAVIV
jgi:large subunit ribosomal protein L15